MNSPLQKVADDVRGISLPELMTWHGFKLRREGVSFRAKTDRHNIVITGQKWFDNKVGVGGAGAIDLQMHLSGGDFQTTCLVLAHGFRPLIGNLEFPPERRVREAAPRATFDELVAKYAVPSSMNWPAARDYLIETRKIDAALVDKLHEAGTIYANTHFPNPGIVFLHRSLQGKVEGATLRDTRHESSFRPTLGNKLTAWFCVGDLTEAKTVVAVESPIDALSYPALFVGKSDPTAILSCGGSYVSTDMMFEAYERKQCVVVALDNDDAGERGWQKAWDETVECGGFDIRSECPQRKDWNDGFGCRDPTSATRPTTSTIAHPWMTGFPILFLERFIATKAVGQILSLRTAGSTATCPPRETFPPPPMPPTAGFVTPSEESFQG